MASSWGLSWGTSWADSWGIAAVARDPDAGPRIEGRHRPRRVIIHGEPEDEQTAPQEKRRKVTRKAVTAALSQLGDLQRLLSPEQAMEAAPVFVEYTRPPSTDLSDQQLFIRALVNILRIEAERLAEEEAVIVLLLAA